MEQTNSLVENSIPWINEDFVKPTTNTPEELAQEGPIGTLVIIIVSAIVSILFLFVVAVFIDCRHQKLNKEKSNPKKMFRINIPTFNRSPIREDKQTIADKMQTPETSAAPSIVIA